MTMKIYNVMLLAALLGGLSSCGDSWLDSEPSTSIATTKSITRLSEAGFALNGVYDLMQSSDAYSGRLIYYGDVTGDDMQAVSATKRTGNYYRFNFTRDNAPESHWSYLYGIIQNCNVILDGLDKLTVTTDEQATFDDTKGQALCLRAMAYFDLTRLFGYPYLKDKGASLGVPLVLDVSSTTSKPSRNTVAECYAQILKDLSEGIRLVGTGFSKGHINRWGALTLLSRVQLYKGDNAAALEAAKQAIAGAESNGYALWSNTDYPTAWAADASEANPGEVLFEIVNLTTDSPGRESMGYLSSKDGYDDEVVTVSFYHLLSQDPHDVRLKILSFDGSSYAYVNKFQPQGNEAIMDANIPLIRLSEAYLNAAEAAQKLGDNSQAVAYLDPIVRRANPDNTVQGTTVTLDRVLTERRKELVGEGHRMFDVIRNGMKVERRNETDKHLAKTRHNTSYMEYDWTFGKIVLPIPKAERDANPNIQQNPEY